MISIARFATPVVAAAILVACAADDQPHAPAVELEARQADAHAALVRLMDEDLDANRRAAPTWATGQGDRRFDHLWPDVSESGRRARLDDARARLVALDAIDRDALSDRMRVNAMLLQHELERRIDAANHHDWQMPVSQISGPQVSLPQLPDSITLTTEKHERDYITRLETLPAYLDQIVTNMRAGLDAGRTPPRVIIGPAADQALDQGRDAYLEDPTRHPMYRPFAGRDDDRARAAASAIRDHVVPAFAEFGRFLRDEYIPACRDTIAASDLPDGRAYYDFRLREESTLDLTADDIHEIGRREVARIRAEMMGVIARSDFPDKDRFSGDELFRRFVAYLRTDPRFYFTDPDELLDAYRVIAKEIDPWMTRLFGTLPRLSYGVREMPYFVARSAPTAYYYPGSLETGVPGYFVANTWRLDQRPKYDMIPLTLHEAVPGHHHQIAIAQELEEAGLHEWRTIPYYTAFSEGWALYAESLGLEMGDGRGMYADPYDDFGRLNFEMWRALRLVVDTGVHAKGWTRQQAVEYMRRNSALADANIEAEVNRYISWPGQAVAYKLGEIHIQDLRDHAEAALGDDFNIRAFHDALLENGALPLDALSAQIDEWIERVKNAS